MRFFDGSNLPFVLGRSDFSVGDETHLFSNVLVLHCWCLSWRGRHIVAHVFRQVQLEFVSVEIFH